MTPEEITAPIAFRLLGNFEIALQGVSITGALPSKAQALVALLILRHGHWQERKELAAALWPTSDIESRNVSFRQQLSLLRKALGSEKWRVNVENHALQLDLTDAFVDTFAFQENLRLAEETGVETYLEAAHRLYRGPFMKERPETYFQATRNSFQQSYLKMLLGLAEAAVLRREPEQAIRYLQEGVACAPEQESIARFLMRLHIEREERDEARTVFLNFQEALRKTRKGEPEPETLALWNRLESPREASKTSPSPALDRPAPRSEPHKRRLPNPLSSLIGREEELEQIRTRFYRHSLVTLVGPGGVGKTRLAAEMARRQQAAYAAGTAFVDLSALPESRAVLPVLLKIAEALPDLGIRETPGRPFTQALASALSDQHLLLVIDNCEQVIAECAGIIKELLETCPALHILATSREELRIPGESVYFVPALNLPSPEVHSRPETLIYADSVRLFVERVQDRQPDFEVSAENGQAIAKICHALDGMPLALELAAVMTDTLTIADLTEQLCGDYWFLTGRGDRTRPERYQTLHATIEWSYRALQPDEQTLLNSISVLAGDWTLEAARALCPPGTPIAKRALPLLSSLVHKSMVVAEKQEQETRYRLLGTIQQYGREQLAESGEEATLRERHAAYFGSLAKEMETEMAGANQKEALDRVQSEQENLRAAMRWAQETNHIEAGLTTAIALWRFWFVRAFFEEGIEWLTSFVHLAGEEHEELRQKALNGAGNLAYAQRDYPTARCLFEAALAIAQQRGDALACARISGNIGNVANAEGNYEEARTCFEQSLAGCRESNDRIGSANALGNLASVASHQGNFTLASTYQQEALTLFRELKKWQNLCLSLNNLADTYLRMGRESEVPSLLAESLALSQEIGSRSDVLHGLYNLLVLAVRWNAEEQAAMLIGTLEAYQEIYAVLLPETVLEEKKQLHWGLLARLGARAFEAARERGRALPPGQIAVPLLTS